MNIVARQNKVIDIMSKIESVQNWNRIAFFVSFGAVLHACSNIGSLGKMHAVDCVSVPVAALTVKKAYSLSKKEEKGRRLWDILQKKSAVYS